MCFLPMLVLQYEADLVLDQFIELFIKKIDRKNEIFFKLTYTFFLVENYLRKNQDIANVEQKVICLGSN